MPGHLGEAGSQVDPAELARIHLPETFVVQVNSILTPGATLLVTDEALSPQTSGTVMQIVDADPRNARNPSRL